MVASSRDSQEAGIVLKAIIVIANKSEIVCPIDTGLHVVVPSAPTINFSSESFMAVG